MEWENILNGRNISESSEGKKNLLWCCVSGRKRRHCDWKAREGGRERYDYVGVGHLQASQTMVRNLDLCLCTIEHHWIELTKNFN